MKCQCVDTHDVTGNRQEQYFSHIHTHTRMRTHTHPHTHLVSDSAFEKNTV